MANSRRRYGLTGGGSGALDAIDGTDLTSADIALTVDANNVMYSHKLDPASGAAESSPDVIAPDTNAGNKRWILSGWWGRVYNGLTLAAQAVGFTIAGGTTSKTLTVDETATLSAKANLVSPSFTTPVLGTPTSGTLNNCTTNTEADNDSTTQLASTAFAKSQDAVLARLPNQAVNMTAAASGSSGIAVADNDNIDFGAGNFTLVWRGSLPNWVPSAEVFIWDKYSAGSDGYTSSVRSNGKLWIYLNGTGGVTADKTATNATGFVDGTTHEIVYVVTRETASVAGSIGLFNDGILIETFVIDAGSNGSINNTQALNILGVLNSGIRQAGTCSFAAAYNRALTAAEVLDLYRNGIAFADKWASQTAQTSGTLTIGKRYRIDNWITNDDFTNVGGANVDGTEFVATGTTPTTWTNLSTVYPIGATLALEPEGIQNDKWYDSSSNALNATYPATGWSLMRKLYHSQDLNITASPTFVTAKLSGLTDGYIPKHTSDAVGLVNSPIYTDGTNVGIGTTGPNAKLDVWDGNFTLSDTDVAHGMTSIAVTTTYAKFAPTSTTIGGLSLTSLSDATLDGVLTLNGIIGAADPIDTDSAILIRGGKINGTTWQALGATETVVRFDNFSTLLLTMLGSGNVGIGMSPSVQFELSGAVGQKSSGTTWANPSDARLKNIAGNADLDRCWEIIKGIPLRRYELKPEAFSDKQISDRNKLGWIADDVEVFFPKSTPKNTFKLVPIPDGEEEYEEQDFIVEQVEKEETSIEIIEGKPIQVTKIVISEVKTLLFDDVPVLYENDQPVMRKVSIEPQVTEMMNAGVIDEVPIKIESYEPLTHPVPRMVKKTRPKLKTDVIEDCRSLDADQLFAAMYGALQKSMSIIEDLQARISKLEVAEIGKI